MAPSRLRPELSSLGTTIFAEMSSLAVEHGAINLGQGFPDLDGPEEIKAVAIDAINAGRNQYPPGIGIPELRQAIASHQRRMYEMEWSPETDVLVTAGATEAIAAAILALVSPGEEVVLMEPFYDAYYAATLIAGGSPRAVRLRGTDFSLDPEELRSQVSGKSRVIVLNNPHNPSGKVFTREELLQVAAVAEEFNLVVLADEVYEHLVFEGSHLHFASLPGMRERTISISSMAKSFSLTGWKIGWATGPANLVSAVKATKQFLTYVNGAPFQPAAAFALDNAERLVPEVREPLRAQRDLLAKGLASLGFNLHPCNATYFVISDLGPATSTDSRRFCLDLIERAGVAAIPTSAFYLGSEPPVEVRWTFSKQRATLAEALDRLGRVKEW